MDITNLVKVRDVLSYLKPEVVINCAAATNVDRCEIDEDYFKKQNKRYADFISQTRLF